MRLPVFYTPKMVAEPDSFSPSARKPAQVVASWADLAIEVVEPPPVTVDQLARAHQRAFVEDVLACRQENGFGDHSPGVAASLPFTSGAMLAAARRARTSRIACAPVSGFHHARYAYAGAFCTFNGLVVAAMALHAEDGVRKVGIVDCDAHYGDGTDELIERHRLTWIDHFTAGDGYTERHHAAALLAHLPERLRAMRDCDVVLYQAGADPHVDDPLGGMMTTDEMRERDEIVFDTLRGVPVAWNLAGGYQDMATLLAIHANTARAAIAALHR